MKFLGVKHLHCLLILKNHQNRLSSEVTAAYLLVSVVDTIHANFMLSTLLEIHELDYLIPSNCKDKNCGILLFWSKAVAEVKVRYGFGFADRRAFDLEHFANGPHCAHNNL
jgi:hypothetical protein